MIVVAAFFVNVTAASCLSASEATGQVTEFALPIANHGYPPNPDGIAAGADGNLWVAETGVNKIAQVTPTGTITEFPIKGGMLPSSVTAGPDGNVWFGQRGGVGSITPAGKVTLYKVDGIISSITPGSDGNLWFTETFRGKIGRVTPSGQITRPCGFMPSRRPREMMIVSYFGSGRRDQTSAAKGRFLRLCTKFRSPRSLS